MLDEQLIHEVQNHSVIYNRQKYFINSSDPKKYLSKEGAWQEIAIKLNSDIETCKKRWKYLRERYVQQRKQGDPPNYEHLSRPYLDKMKFLDKHIQPRKSYKQVTSFLSSPNGSFPEYMDSSRSNGSLGNTGYHNNYLDSTFIKEEPQGSFQNFTTDLSPSSHQSIQNSQQQNVKAHHHHQQQSTREFFSTAAAVVAAAAAASSQTTSTTNNNNPSKRHNNHNNHNNNNNSNNINNNVNGNNFRNGDVCHIPCPPSSSSSLKSIKSPLSSPRINIDHNNVDVDLKRPRIDIRSSSATTTINNNHRHNNNDDSSDNNVDDGDGDDDDDDDIHTKRNNLIPNLANNIHNLNGRLLHNSNHHNDLFSLFQQQFTQHQHATTAAAAALNHPIKCSEQLLGELVTSELLKMTKERQKIVQRKILEILFFDD